MFGVHGPQVVRDLHVLEQWTDPKADLGENVARLTTKTGLDLLRKTTGLDPEARFDEAKGIVLGVLQEMGRAAAGPCRDDVGVSVEDGRRPTTPGSSSRFWKRSPAVDAGRKTQALSNTLGQVLADKPELKWLQAIADRGILAAAQDLDRVSALARATLAVLNGDVLKRLHDFIGDSLDLGTFRQAAQDADFGALNEWLVGRLGDLIDEKTAGIEQLKQVQQAVFAVDRKVKDVYETGIEALNKRYAAEFAATYQRTTADTALLDVTFDLSQPKSLALFRSVVEEGDLSTLLVTEIEGVTLNNAALSHELGRTTHVELRLPFWSKDVTHVTQSIASLSVEEHAGRVLVYEFSASDKVTTSNRARSELSVLGSLRAAPGGGAPIAASGTVAYEARQVAKGMRALDFERRTRPFLETYLSGLFPDGEASLEAFYDVVSAAAAGGVGGDTDGLRSVLGDVALSMQVTYPAGVLASWLLPRDDAAVRADGMKLSRSVQVNLRRLIARTHFENIDNLEFNESVAALLVWTSMPVSTSIGRNLDPVRFNTDRGFFWDYVDRDMRFAVARDPHTGTALGAALADAYARLRAAGKAECRSVPAGPRRPVRADGPGPDGRRVPVQPPERRIADRVRRHRCAPEDCGGGCRRGDGADDGCQNAVGICGHPRGHVQRAPAVPVHARGRAHAGTHDSGRGVGRDPPVGGSCPPGRDADGVRARAGPRLRAQRLPERRAAPGHRGGGGADAREPVMRAPFSAGVLAAALVLPDIAYRPSQAPQPAADSYEYEGRALTADQKIGRDTWYFWTAGNQKFWRRMAVTTSGNVDLLTYVDSRNHAAASSGSASSTTRGARRRAAPDRYGLWMDDCSAAEPVPQIPGIPAGIVGLRRFDNPAFDAAKWNVQAYLADRTIEPPYLVGMSCGFCHVGFNPVKPPADPEPRGLVESVADDRQSVLRGRQAVQPQHDAV